MSSIGKNFTQKTYGEAYSVMISARKLQIYHHAQCYSSKVDLLMIFMCPHTSHVYFDTTSINRQVLFLYSHNQYLVLPHDAAASV